MLYKYEYLLIGPGAAHFKEKLQLRRPTQAAVIQETHWNNRLTPLPPGFHLLVRTVEGQAPQVKFQRADGVDRLLFPTSDERCDDFGERLLQEGPRWGLPTLQPANSTGLHPDTQIRAYEEQYETEGCRLLFKQGLTFLAQNHAQEWVFVRSEPHAVYLTLETTLSALPRRIGRALTAAHALPAIAPADHAQQLTRMQPWWRHGKPLPNLPPTEQIAQLQEVELESKLAVPGEFAPVSWRLAERLRADAIAGFTLYEGDALVRHTYDCVRYLKGKNKLILQGPTYRFAQKERAAFAATNPPNIVLMRTETKPGYQPIATYWVAQEITRQCEKLKPLGDVTCHKRKFMVQSLATGGGYHVLIDRSRAFGYPTPPLVQIEIECQWKKLPPRVLPADPVAVAVAEIQQLTAALCTSLPGLQPTALTKRGWLKQIVNDANALAA